MPGAENSPKSFFVRHADVLLVVGVVGTLVALVVPLPPLVLDVMLTFDFSYTLLLLMVVLGLNTPLELFTYPSLLLVGTLFRLAANVASTRLILLDAYAGKVIQAFGEFVVGGNMVVGIIMFLIIVVIQFKVINEGSGRIAEVAARFTLDGMPGKQMAIDADLNSGMITEEEARERRAEIVQEAEFYGAMDGAAKFIKGDAIAGLLILMINLVGGVIVGMMHGMDVGGALRTYAVLTVGDGLVSQVPAVIMATTAGVLVTKTQSEVGLSEDITRQVLANRRAVGMAAIVVFGFGAMPGLPLVPFAILGLTLTGIYFALKRPEPEDAAEPEIDPEAVQQQKENEEAHIRSLLEPDRIAVEVGYNLIQLIDPARGGSLLERIKSLRKQFARELGIVVPKVRILDNVALDTNSYIIKLMGHNVAEGRLHPGWVMVMNPGGGKPRGITSGVEDTDPSFGLPVRWVPPSERDEAQVRGHTVVDAESVFVTHLSEVIRRHAHEILSRQDVQRMIDNVKEDNAAVVESLIPEVLSLAQVQQVLENLLVEGIPINNLSYILEKVGNYAPMLQDTTMLTELVRKSLSRAICEKFSDDEGHIHALSLDPRIEEELRESIEHSEGEVHINLAPGRLRQIMGAITEQARAGLQGGGDTVVLTDSEIRPYLRSIISRVFPDIAVISYDEISEGVEVISAGVISTDTNSAAERETIPEGIGLT